MAVYHFNLAHTSAYSPTFAVLETAKINGRYDSATTKLHRI